MDRMDDDNDYFFYLSLFVSYCSQVDVQHLQAAAQIGGGGAGAGYYYYNYYYCYCCSCYAACSAHSYIKSRKSSVRDWNLLFSIKKNRKKILFHSMVSVSVCLLFCWFERFEVS